MAKSVDLIFKNIIKYVETTEKVNTDLLVDALKKLQQEVKKD